MEQRTPAVLTARLSVSEVAWSRIAASSSGIASAQRPATAKSIPFRADVFAAHAVSCAISKRLVAQKANTRFILATIRSQEHAADAGSLPLRHVRNRHRTILFSMSCATKERVKMSQT